MFMVVFDGYSVGPEIRHLIEKYYVGGVLLTPRNIRGACDSSAAVLLLRGCGKLTGAIPGMKQTPNNLPRSPRSSSKLRKLQVSHILL